MIKKEKLIRILLISCLVVYGGVAQEQENKRSFRIDDILNIESLSESYSFSTDGKFLAFVLRRTVNTDIAHNYIWSNDRSDVWIVDQKTQTAVNLTKGEIDSSAFWYPVWSPNSEKLAMLSSRKAEGGYARVWIWDRKTNIISQLCDRYVDVHNDVDVGAYRYKIFWVSDSVLVLPTIPKKIRPIEIRTNRQKILELSENWFKAMGGAETTTLTFESGRVIEKEELVGGKFVGHNVNTNECTEIMDSNMGPIYDWAAQTVVPSPNMDVVAVFNKEVALPGNAKQTMFRINTYRYGVHLFDHKTEQMLKELGELKNAVPGSLRWSPDGDRLAFIGSLDRNLDVTGTGEGSHGPTDVFTLNLKSGKLETIPMPSLRLAAKRNLGLHPSFEIAWANNEAVVVRAKKKKGSEPGEDGWWLVDNKSEPFNVTVKLDFVPDKLYPALGSSFLLCADRANLWLVSLAGEYRKLTRHSSREEISILWVDGETARGKSVNKLLYQIRRGDSRSFYYFDLSDATSQAINTPNNNAEFKSFSSVNQSAVFLENDRTGMRMWLSSVGSTTPKSIFGTNRFLQDIAEGEVRDFNYMSIEGDSLNGLLLLPPGYRNGKKYPMVTWVYQARVQNNRHSLATISTLNPLNLQALASAGYAVLFPSMPGKPKSLLDLSTGVLPAIDKVIEMGIADPNKIVVMGQSNGGFSTYGLISLTNRFKAAVALAGMTDFTSISLQFPPFDYRVLAEWGPTVGRLASLESWWDDWGLPWRSSSYAKNSPIMYVERVHTPLLILHGDFDGVPIQQAEEYYTSLWRLGKRAKFVRYLGEGHVFFSPANIRDMWAQVFAWCDEFCDISRNSKGDLIWDGNRVKSRNGAPALKPEDFLKLESFFDQNFGKAGGHTSN